MQQLIERLFATVMLRERLVDSQQFTEALHVLEQNPRVGLAQVLHERGWLSWQQRQQLEEVIRQRLPELADRLAQSAGPEATAIWERFPARLTTPAGAA